MKYTKTPLTDTQQQLLIKITTKLLSTCMNLITKYNHTIYQNLFQKNNFEPLQPQDPSKTPTEPASTQKVPLIDAEIQNHLTINKETYIPILLLSTNLTLKINVKCITLQWNVKNLHLTV